MHLLWYPSLTMWTFENYMHLRLRHNKFQLYCEFNRPNNITINIITIVATESRELTQLSLSVQIDLISWFPLFKFSSNGRSLKLLVLFWMSKKQWRSITSWSLFVTNAEQRWTGEQPLDWLRMETKWNTLQF